MDLKTVFTQLTRATIPHGKEHLLKPVLDQYIPNEFALTQDKHGNYWLRIGEKPTTLFTAHLDSYCKKLEPVNHVFEGNMIKTDGTTILGADNKAGVAVLLSLIEAKKPGLYYFFIGEEALSTPGCLGSTKALQHNPEQFQGITKAISFDRRAYGSIITHQMGRPCCSPTFTAALAAAFGKHDLPFKGDPSGRGTDSAIFEDVAPECTNLSVGVFDEHKTSESIDISYLGKVINAAKAINWEALPVARDISFPMRDYTSRETQVLVSMFRAGFSLANAEEYCRGLVKQLQFTHKKHPTLAVRADDHLITIEKPKQDPVHCLDLTSFRNQLSEITTGQPAFPPKLPGKALGLSGFPIAGGFLSPYTTKPSGKYPIIKPSKLVPPKTIVSPRSKHVNDSPMDFPPDSTTNDDTDFPM